MRLSLALILVCLTPLPGLGESTEPPVTARLIADRSALAPGRPFTLGVLFTIAPDWHIYWKNPGDSGLPTSVRFTGPAGFEVGPLQWPIPAAFRLPGDILDYGYEKSGMLLATVTVPTDLKAGQSVTFTADAQWLMCHKQCLPGQQQLSLTIPVADAPSVANPDLFDSWRQALPSAVGGSPVRIHVAGAFAAEARSAELRVQLQWTGDMPNAIEFYPAPSPGLRIQNIVASPQAISFTTSLRASAKLSDQSLRGVLVYTDAAGRRRGIDVSVPLSPANVNGKEQP